MIRLFNLNIILYGATGDWRDWRDWRERLARTGLNWTEATGANSAKRINKKNGETQIKTRQIILSFDECCPAYIQLGWERRRVEIFIPNPIRCYNCQRFGHLAKYCTAEVRCSRCAEKHTIQECSKNEKVKIICAKLQWAASDKLHGLPKIQNSQRNQKNSILRNHKNVICTSSYET